MHIVYLTPNFYPSIGGIETYVYELSRRLADRGHEVSVVTSDRLRNGKRLKKFEEIYGIKVYRVPFKLVMRYNFSPSALKMLPNLDYDVLHINSIGFFTDIIPIIKSRKSGKIIVSTHGGIFHTPHMKFIKKIYFKSLVKESLKHADFIIATSHNDFKLFSKICDKSKIGVAYPGVNWTELGKLKRVKNKNTLLYVGRFAENKRLDRMLHVMAELKVRVKDAKLLLIGEDWGEKTELLKLAKKLNLKNHVRFLSKIRNHYRYFSKSNIFLLSSEYEGFGTSVVEAMASGLPAIVNDIETIHEIVENGKNGFIVDFENYKKAAEIISSVLENTNLQKRLGRNARISTKKFDWNGIIDRIEKIYEK